MFFVTEYSTGSLDCSLLHRINFKLISHGVLLGNLLIPVVDFCRVVPYVPSGAGLCCTYGSVGGGLTCTVHVPASVNDSAYPTRPG